MNELALFAGAGGGLLGSRLLGWRTVCYVERDPYCVRILTARIADGCLDDGPIWDDATTFDGRPWAGLVDVVTAGFPCQPFSVAGKRRGEADERNLWPETIRIIAEVGPRFALLENVPGIISGGYIDTVLEDLRKAGFSCLPPLILGADDVGAPHRRKRVWILAHSKGVLGQRVVGHEPNGILSPYVPDPIGQRGFRETSCLPLAEEDRWPANHRERCLPYAPHGGCHGGHNVQRKPATEEAEDCGCATETWWASEPGVCGVAYGVAHRVDRLRALGNGQVPRVVAEAWRLLKECVDDR